MTKAPTSAETSAPVVGPTATVVPDSYKQRVRWPDLAGDYNTGFSSRVKAPGRSCRISLVG